MIEKPCTTEEIQTLWGADGVVSAENDTTTDDVMRQAAEVLETFGIETRCLYDESGDMPVILWQFRKKP